MKKTILLSLATMFAFGTSFAQQPAPKQPLPTPAGNAKPAPLGNPLNKPGIRPNVKPAPAVNPAALQNPKPAVNPANNPVMDPKAPKVDPKPGQTVKANGGKHPAAAAGNQVAPQKHHVVQPPIQVNPNGPKNK